MKDYPILHLNTN